MSLRFLDPVRAHEQAHVAAWENHRTHDIWLLLWAAWIPLYGGYWIFHLPRFAAVTWEGPLYRQSICTTTTQIRVIYRVDNVGC